MSRRTVHVTTQHADGYKSSVEDLNGEWELAGFNQTDTTTSITLERKRGN